jgi:hypothetical protein
MTSAAPPRKEPRTDSASALEALKRARKRAEEVAAATGTAIIQWENGRIVRFYPGRMDPGDHDPGSEPR